jgi:hypothetical protein
MRRSLILLLQFVAFMTPLALLFALAYGGALNGTATISVASPSPTGGATPGPPALSNAQIFQNGLTYGGQTIDGSGNNDSYIALKAAMNAGDVDVKPGTYKLLPPINGFYQPPSGRNILCENNVSAGPPTTANATVVFKVPIAAASGQSYQLFNDWSSGTLYGCEIEGYHYPNISWSNENCSNCDDTVVKQFSAHDLNVYNNGFDGWPGATGVIDINEANQAAFNAGTWPHNINIKYNRFANCNVRSVEIDYGRNVQITNNTMLNCPTKAEIQNWHWTGMSVWWDHNHITMNSGAGIGITNCGLNGSDAGSVCISGISNDNNPSDDGNFDKYCSTYGSGLCSSSCQSDYSGNAFSNNTMDGTNNQCTDENDTANGYVNGGLKQSVYRDNIYSGGAQKRATPGSSTGNSWLGGLPSNQ